MIFELHALLELAVHVFIYGALFFLAIVCVITANSLTKDSPKIQKTILVAKLVSCFTLFICTYYRLTHVWILLSIIPLIFGAAFGLIESLHTQNIHLIIEIKKLTRTQLVSMFIKTFKRDKK